MKGRIWSLLAGVVVGLLGITPVAAQSAPGGGAWTPGLAAAGDRNSLAGVIDAPPNGASVQTGTLTLTGWFVDLTAQGWAGVDDVEVFLGTMDGGGRPLGHALFQQSRPDVAAVLKNPYWAPAGWSANVSTLTLPPGPNTVSVYAHVPGKGWWLRQVSINIPSAPPPPRGAPAVVQPVPAPPSPTGNDLSFPECSTGAEPSGPAFGIIGTNGGHPFTPNPCLAREFVWALSSTSPSQARVGLYMNTANPGSGASPNWPAAGASVPRMCDGSWTVDCAYDYGWTAAQYAFARAADVTGRAAAAQYPWWLDVESANSWSAQQDTNAAAVQGALDYLRSVHVASLGIYSTLTDWEALIGPAAPQAAFGGLLNWRPGATNLQDAPSWCSRTVSGGRVKYVQFPSGGFDTDFACF